MIQPIIVRRADAENAKYEIIAGERRWLAARQAGLHEIPVVVTDVDDLKSLEFAIVENVQRHDLNPLEEAQGYKRLIDEFSYDQEKVSRFIGKSRSYITNSLRLLNLPQEVLKFIEEKKIKEILNENNFSAEESIQIIRTFLIKTKRLQILTKEVSKTKSIDAVITGAKPPIFWKEKEVIKQQLTIWSKDKISNLIKRINSTELLIIKNSINSINILMDFIFEETTRNTSNYS